MHVVAKQAPSLGHGSRSMSLLKVSEDLIRLADPLTDPATERKKVEQARIGFIANYFAQQTYTF